MTRRFTTADLYNLMEGITPGPWEPFHDTWEDYGPDGEVTAEYEQWGIIGAADGILDTPPRQSLMDAPNQWAESGEHDNQANTRLAAAAPELAAELHRIRTELEALRDDVLRVSEKWNHTSADGDRPLQDRVEATIKLGTANAITMRISEILNGDTNE